MTKYTKIEYRRAKKSCSSNRESIKFLCSFDSLTAFIFFSFLSRITLSLLTLWVGLVNANSRYTFGYMYDKYETYWIIASFKHLPYARCLYAFGICIGVRAITRVAHLHAIIFIYFAFKWEKTDIFADIDCYFILEIHIIFVSFCIT